MPRKSKVSLCVYIDDNEKACIKPGIGKIPLCAKHAKFRQEIEEEIEEREANANVFNGLVETVMQRPEVGSITSKINSIFDKVAKTLDKVAVGDFSDIPNFKFGKQPYVQNASRNIRNTPSPTEDPRVVLGFSAKENLTKEKIKTRRKELARIFHSDVAGNDESMKRVNIAADSLLRTIK